MILLNLDSPPSDIHILDKYPVCIYAILRVHVLKTKPNVPSILNIIHEQSYSKIEHIILYLVFAGCLTWSLKFLAFFINFKSFDF